MTIVPKKKIAPSIMCVDFFNLDRTIEEFEKDGVDLIHADIMDGAFVPNFTLGTDFIRALKKRTSLPIDLHLMITDPERKLDLFDFGENDMVSVHCESTAHLHKAVAAIKERGAKAFAAINPATPTGALEAVAEDIDGVLIMTVNPGFAGQKLIPSTLKKIEKTRRFLDSEGFFEKEIEVDGNVSFENAEIMARAGANIFVAGTSSLFRKDLSFEDSIRKMREAIR